MVANATPVLIKKGHPLDSGKTLSDGFRLFGDGKTFEGFFAGSTAGIIISVLEAFLATKRIETLVIDSSLSIGALLGDLAGAFIKRRLGFPRGSPSPLLDQLDFVLGGYFLSSLISVFLNGNFEVFGDLLPASLQLQIVTTSLYIIPIIHLLTNRIAYRLKLKGFPW
ncbi:hypothetical protein B9Q13_02335 [Candidatus Marsarchaeota G2 archaeon ECH_B_SAG-G16]|uniref:CDP-2,3-bis-(O-geranylgeranyl)-sn-glycerol synthase n=1 Tax=Candidatus Marsarchaeota G2 archaeon ECH_B_SAG-G16 TaxID=1978167 RepID=A0A2R6C347_9ARCH|nr:MAG: hypothetical protein B9Q13_02335 [Candidatus Marsarchaeota G2 archaeon ECH_B_SAG-G16]